MQASAPSLDPQFVAAFRAGTLTPAEAEAVVPDGDRAAFIFLLLQLSSTLGAAAPAGGPHTPSGSLPPYAKDGAAPRRKKRGGRDGHPPPAAAAGPVGPLAVAARL